jgi:hypothetical protein
LKNSNFKGSWSPNLNYIVGDSVAHLGKFYLAKTNIENQQNESILNTAIWLDISWRRAVDLNYKGEWSNINEYSRETVVSYNNEQYIALTNVPLGTTTPNAQPDTDADQWQILETKAEYSNVISKLTIDDFDNFGLSYLIGFVEDFKLSKSGDVLVTKTRINTGDSSSNVKLVVYRSTLEDRYTLSEVISLDQLQNIDYSNLEIEFDLSDDGSEIVVSQPLQSDSPVTNGSVHYYRLSNSVFEETQIIEPPISITTLKYGTSVSLKDNSLYVSSITQTEDIVTNVIYVYEK